MSEQQEETPVPGQAVTVQAGLASAVSSAPAPGSPEEGTSPGDSAPGKPGG